MADSDDEYDRKRRDKFRGERGSGESYRSERRDDRRGGAGGPGAGAEWPERNPFRGGASAAGAGAGGGAPAGGGRGRPEYFDYRQRFGSPSRERPPAKRMRTDWAEELRPGPRYGGYDPYLMHAWNEHYAAHSMHAPYAPHPVGHGGGHGREPPAMMNNDMPTQPPMLTLKQFLEGQDDSISDSEVLNKYAEYKLDFKRTQLNEFFVTHKDAEWFKNKYHPLESTNRRAEHMQYLKNRVTVFTELLENGQISSVSVDTSQTDPLLRLLDTVVIKLEGGTDEDLKILDEKPKEIVFPEKKIERDDDVIITSVENKKPAAKDKSDVETVPRLVSPLPIKRVAQSDEENWDDDEPVTVVPAPSEPPTSEHDGTEKKAKSKKSLKRKRSHSDSSSSSSNSDSDSSSSSSSDDEDDEKVKNYDLESLKKEDDDEEDEEKSEPAKVENENSETNLLDEKSNESVRAAANDTPTEDEVKPPASPLNDEEESKTDSKPNADDEDINDDDKAMTDAAAASIKKEENVDDAVTIDLDNEAQQKDDANKVEEPETIDLDTVKDGPQPRPLHRTSSIFLRNLAPHITKAEIEALCTRYDGYLRVAIADPLPERRWYRRGWVTFKRDVNIKEICWNLNNTRIKDCEMGAIVNRDLSRRVRPVNGLTAHKSVVRADIKLCAKLTMLLDEKFKLWMQNNEENQTETTNGNGNGNGEASSATSGSGGGSSYGFNSKNPVLQNITDFLIEEASAEEEELLGITNENKEGDGEGVERDPQLIAVLDRLILYLRIIHSVDFYNHCEYPYEDEMPNRCGIIHARGPPPSKVTQNDIQDYIKNFENKMQTFLAKPQVIEESELKKLGAKDAEEEVEKFIQANTQELAKDKWLCPLSGKKFKGPEFIRKHIFNKHAEKVEEVRKEVEFFNNYLKDPKRPQLPEHPGNTKRTISESSGGGGGFRPPVYPPAYAPPYAAYLPPMMMPGRGGRGFGGGVGVGRRMPPHNEYRQLKRYRDLDAPEEPYDMFN